MPANKNMLFEFTCEIETIIDVNILVGTNIFVSKA